MHEIRIDRSKPLSAEPHLGHNRYHPDIEPVLEVGEGEEVVIETRDAVDGQIGPETTEADFADFEVGAVHPLTGRSRSRARNRAMRWRSNSWTSCRRRVRSARSCLGSASCATS